MTRVAPWVRAMRGEPMQETQPRHSVVTALFERHIGSLAPDVDSVEATLWLFVLVSVTLDVYTTYLGLAAGLVEANPVMHWVIEGYGFAAFGVIKALVVAAAGLFRELRPRYGTAIALGLAVPWGVTVAINVVTLWMV